MGRWWWTTGFGENHVKTIRAAGLSGTLSVAFVAVTFLWREWLSESKQKNKIKRPFFSLPRLLMYNAMSSDSGCQIQLPHWISWPQSAARKPSIPQLWGSLEPTCEVQRSLSTEQYGHCSHPEAGLDWSRSQFPVILELKSLWGPIFIRVSFLGVAVVAVQCSSPELYHQVSEWGVEL
jgi:hypothetical protein